MAKENEMSVQNFNESNGLNMIELNSTTSAFDIKDARNLSYNDLLSLIGSKIKDISQAIIYLDYKILIGRFIDGKFEFYKNETFEPKFIQKMRIFNEKEEIYLWKNENDISGRHRTDSAGKGVKAIEVKQALFGTRSESLDGGFVKLTEERGTEIILPSNGLKLPLSRQEKIFIKTRNYVGHLNNNDQATYVDCRFVKFI